MITQESVFETGEMLEWVYYGNKIFRWKNYFFER